MHLAPLPPPSKVEKQAMWYIYGTARVSKTTFEDEFFRDMVRAHNPNAAFIQRKAIKYQVAAELILFEVAMAWVVQQLTTMHEGNAFAQGMHDGVTLHNKRCYQAMGAQVIFRGESMTLAFGFKPLSEHSAKSVAQEFSRTWEERADTQVGH